MFRSLAAAILTMIALAPGVQAQDRRCDKVDVTFSCKDGSGGGPSPYKCRAGESEKDCCRRWRGKAAGKWCSGTEGGLAAFACACPKAQDSLNAALRPRTGIRGVPGPAHAADGDPDRPLVTGRVHNSEPSRGGAAAEPTQPAERRRPHALRDGSRALSSPKVNPGPPEIRSRTFEPERAYSGVRLQQGRVLTDSDLNEQKVRVCHKTRFDLMCTDGSAAAVDVTCRRGEPEATCCRRGRTAAAKNCIRHGSVRRMKCSCPRSGMRRVR